MVPRRGGLALALSGPRPRSSTPRGDPRPGSTAPSGPGPVPHRGQGQGICRSALGRRRGRYRHRGPLSLAAGREYDGESGLYYMRARYYDPALGRWISEDPIGTAGGLNVYAYAGNDPVNLTDSPGWSLVAPTSIWRAGDENWTCRSEEDKEGTFSAPEQPYWNLPAPGHDTESA
ncbi:MAG: RHS repeat-associated core domain-containing protein [Gemmatimonadetes bacterium]|nr:RHS repeat-associated core domain-containing protein [Gemmatimonadota bacterium]